MERSRHLPLMTTDVRFVIHIAANVLVLSTLTVPAVLPTDILLTVFVLTIVLLINIQSFKQIMEDVDLLVELVIQNVALASDH